MSDGLESDGLRNNFVDDKTPKVIIGPNTLLAETSPTTILPEEDTVSKISTRLGPDGFCINPVDENTLAGIEAAIALDLSSTTNAPIGYAVSEISIQAISDLIRPVPGYGTTLDDLEPATLPEVRLLTILPEGDKVPKTSTQLRTDGIRINPVDGNLLKFIEETTALVQSLPDIYPHEDILSWSPTSMYSASPVSQSHHFPLTTSSSPTSRLASPSPENPSVPLPTPTTPTSPQTTTRVEEFPACLRVRDPAFLTDFFNEMSSSEESYPASMREQEEAQQREDMHAWVNSKVDEIKEAFSSQFVVFENLLRGHSSSTEKFVEISIGKMKEIEKETAQGHWTVLQLILDVCHQSQQDIQELPDRLLAGLQALIGGEILAVEEKVEKSQVEVMTSIACLEGKLDRALRQFDLMAEANIARSRKKGATYGRKVRFARRRSTSAPPNLVGKQGVFTLQSSKFAPNDSELSNGVEKGTNGGIVIYVEDIPGFVKVDFPKRKAGDDLKIPDLMTQDPEEAASTIACSEVELLLDI